MAKKTKLTEKSARIPEIRKSNWDEAITPYLRDVESLNKEQARSHRFTALLQQLMGVEPNFIENYSAGVEKFLKVKQKDRILKGEADNLFGNVIIEFEVNIPKKRSEAEDQLRRYVAILWSSEKQDSRTPYLCIATDGVRSVTYSPELVSIDKQDLLPNDVKLHVLEEIDWVKLKPHEVFYWLDRYFLRKEILPPTSEVIVRDFGQKSHAFQTANTTLLNLWEKVKNQSGFQVIYDSWEKYLRIVYGSDVAVDELFVRHTYLATLAKLMSWMRISESTSLPDDIQIAQMLEGELFKRQGIENFIEEDFFSWLSRTEAVKVGVEVVRWLFSLLQNYNLRELSEDVLKSLYQELVDPEARQDLGEFYTPDWLAHRMVNKLLDTKPDGTLLDPACGSGTFLYLAIREKRLRLGHSSQTLQHILSSVYGADVHPLAVIVAKTNYILALGDLLKSRKGIVSIPVYLTNSIRLPEQRTQTTLWGLASYVVELDGREVLLPEVLLDDLNIYDRAIELCKDFARHNKGKSIDKPSFHNFLMAQQFPMAKNQALLEAIFAITETLKQFIDNDRDTIWAFILKNIFKPLFFKNKFDFIVGNPPWIVFNSVREPHYQEFLKGQITGRYNLLKGRGELITHMEIATLFLVRAADLYLKSGGSIAFVLPRSLFSSDQHGGLRQRTFVLSEDIKQNLIWREIWDCENVTPLFNVPCCVLVADKCDRELEIKYPVRGEIVRGILKRKNASLKEAVEELITEDAEFFLNTRGKRSFWATEKEKVSYESSFYARYFKQGATIVPRSFWFVQIKPSPLGFDTVRPPLETDPRAIQMAKRPYHDVRFTGNVESDFLYATLLSTDLLPFGHLDYRLAVLPIKPEDDHFELIDKQRANKEGLYGLESWLEKAEGEWETRRSARSEQITVLEWLDYRGKLTTQNPQAKCRVIYNTSGTNLTAAVVQNEDIKFEISEQSIQVMGFLVDYVTYGYETSNRDEPFYLAAFLNAPEVNKLIKPMQARGLWGARHIVKKVFELSIPQFKADNPIHSRLAESGKECTVKVEKWLASGGVGKTKSIGRLRGMVRKMLSDELKEIDKLVKEILG